MRYYLYVLLDTEEQQPFYAGVHAQEAGDCSGLVLTAADLQTLLDDTNSDLSEQQRGKVAAILDAGTLSRLPSEAYRVIVRDLEEQHHAELLRLALLSSWSDFATPEPPNPNRPIRFRPSDNLDGAHKRIAGFDPEPGRNGVVAADNGQHVHGAYFVYALFNPDNNTIFYVGKGRGNRIAGHFNHARNPERVSRANARREKLRKIADILGNGYQPIAATKILARTATDDEAYLLETFYIKHILGSESLENATGGRYNDLIRARYDTAHRHGFEIPAGRNGTSGRRIKEDVFKGQGFDALLEQAAERLNEKLVDDGLQRLDFEPPRITGAGELSVEAPLETPRGQIRLILHIRSPHTRTFTCSTHKSRGRKGESIHQGLWQELCAEYDLGEQWHIGYRRDHRFNPKAWRLPNMARDIETVVDRAFLLCRLVMTPPGAIPELAAEAHQRLVPALIE